MKNLVCLIVASFIIFSCQIEDDEAPTPNESFIKYYGDLTGYEAKDIEFLYDSSGFIVFGNVVADDGSTDYAILRMDLDGNLIDSTYFSFDVPLGEDADGDGELDTLRGDDVAAQVEVFSDGYALVGTTLLNNNSFGVLDVSVATISFFNNDLDKVANQTFAITSGNPREDGLDQLASDVIGLRDGGILLLGSREIDRGGPSDFDYYLLKIGGSNPFEKTIGIPGNNQDDILVRGFEKPNGNIVLIGYSSDVSALGENEGNNGTNVTFTELNATGQILNSVSYGIDNPDTNDLSVFNEVVTGAVSTSAGYAITGTSNLSTEVSYAFFMNLTKNGDFVAGDTLSSAFRFSSGESIETFGLGIAQGRDNDFLILGQYPNFNYDVNVDDPTLTGESRAGEAMFMKVGQFGVPKPGLETHYGSANGDDSAVDALLLPDGKIVVLANVDFGGGIQLVSLIKTNDSGDLVD